MSTICWHLGIQSRAGMEPIAISDNSETIISFCFTLLAWIKRWFNGFTLISITWTCFQSLIEIYVRHLLLPGGNIMQHFILVHFFYWMLEDGGFSVNLLYNSIVFVIYLNWRNKMNYDLRIRRKKSISLFYRIYISLIFKR